MKTTNTVTENKRSGLKKFMRLLTLTALLIALVLGGIKGWRIYRTGMAVYQDVIALRSLAQAPVDEMNVETVTSLLTNLQGNLADFSQEVKPLMWLAPALEWVPTYGGDITNAPALLDLASRLVDASITSLRSAEPLLREVNSSESSLDPAGLTALLVNAQPQLLKAQSEFDQAMEARNRIHPEQLSPRLQEIVSELDPLLGLMGDGLSFSLVLPDILGAGGEGSKTYLILVQNEDELRPTGGFITTIGSLTVEDGNILSLEFESVDNREDWTKPFPSAPWQLQEYMNTSVLILRDSNWYADFPTNALWAEYLYSYTHPGPMDGVIAFDQQFLIMLLGVLGPLDVEGAPYAITSANAVEYMRSAKQPPTDEPAPEGWYRKSFIGDLANVVLEQLVNGQNNDWHRLANVLIQALEERHLLLQLDDPAVAALLAEKDWDNAVRPSAGDFLMTTETNIGFNKTNARMDISLSYDVDLIDLSAPRGALVMTHENNSVGDVQCVHFEVGPAPEDYLYPMDRCYWTYLRVYKQSGVELLASTPHDIPGDWMLLGRGVPARVDILDEQLAGVQGFGTLLVVPVGGSLDTGFEFALPASVVSHTDGNSLYAYRLKVQKQPGTRANSLTIRIHLPNRSVVETINMKALIQDENVQIETDLRTDLYLELVFHVQ